MKIDYRKYNFLSLSDKLGGSFDHPLAALAGAEDFRRFFLGMGATDLPISFNLIYGFLNALEHVGDTPELKGLKKAWASCDSVEQAEVFWQRQLEALPAHFRLRALCPEMQTTSVG